MDTMTCAASGEPIPEGSAFITDADGKHYLPEHYPQPGEEPEPEQLDLDVPEPNKAARK